MISSGAYRFRPDPLTPWGGCTGNGEKMINPGSYRFRLIAFTHLKMINPGSYRFRLIALTHLGGWTGNVEKMINPGYYRFGPGHWQK